MQKFWSNWVRTHDLRVSTTTIQLCYTTYTDLKDLCYYKLVQSESEPAAPDFCTKGKEMLWYITNSMPRCWEGPQPVTQEVCLYILLWRYMQKFWPKWSSNPRPLCQHNSKRWKSIQLHPVLFSYWRIINLNISKNTILTVTGNNWSGNISVIKSGF